MKDRFHSFLFYFGFILSGIFSLSLSAQTTVIAKFGPAYPIGTYSFYNETMYDIKSAPTGSSRVLAIGFKSVLGKHFSLGTELGFQAFQSQLNGYFGPYFSVIGTHSYQQLYYMVVPELSLTSNRLVFLNMGLGVCHTLNSEFKDNTLNTSAFQISNTAAVGFVGLGVNPHFGKAGLLLEIRETLLIDGPSVPASGPPVTSFRANYPSVSLGFTYQID
jgi:hypothetical protein